MVGLKGSIASTVTSMNSNNNVSRNGTQSVNQTTKTENRVEELKKQIASGEYKFDLAKTAEKVAEALI